MKRRMIWLFAAAASVCMGLMGCTTNNIGKTGLEAPGLTRQQVHQRHYEAIQNDLWQLQDDIDSFFLFDRPGRLSPMVVR